MMRNGKTPLKSRILALLLCLAGLVSILLCGTAQASADTASNNIITSAVLPAPKSFFNDAVKFTTTPSNSSDFGTMTTGDFKYNELALAQEYVQCIVDHYPFTLDWKIKDDASKLNSSWNWYNEGCFFNYTGGYTKNVGTVTLYHYNNSSANVCVDFGVYPSDDLVRLTIYYGDNISFRDNGYRCSKDVTSVPTPSPGIGGICYFCGDTGEIECSRCGGRGQIQEYQTTYSFGKKQQVLQWVDCPDCNFGRKPCPWCS